MKELREAREKGLDLEEYKAKLKNGTDFTTSRGGSSNGMSKISDDINTEGAEKEYGPKKGYKKFVGSKGSLDSRLRNVIAYKRSSMASNELIRNSDSGMTENEERELDEMMEDDYDDDEFDFDFDEEEAEYEQAILKAIETNKLNDLKRNFAVESNVYDKAMEKRIDGDDENSSSDSGSGNATTTATGLDVSLPAAGPAGWTEYMGEDDGDDETKADAKEGGASKEKLYQPKRSSWGVFERPADISKTYGGGRVLTKQEMDKMDEEWEERQARKDKALEQWKTTSMKAELQHEDEIKRAVKLAKSYMNGGNRDAAVTQLESVQNYCSWTSELGGEVLLELAMCLETVERVDDARRIYGKLAATSWSPNIKRNALQLISGLDITKQIRNDVSRPKSAMDVEGMKRISQALEAGLSNGWDDWGEGTKSKVQPWFDDGEARASSYGKVDSFRDAYSLLEEALNPLRADKVPSEALMRALKKMYVVSDTEKFSFLRSRGQQYSMTESEAADAKSKKMLSGDAYLREKAQNPAEGTFFASIGLGTGRKEKKQANMYDSLGRRAELGEQEQGQSGVVAQVPNSVTAIATTAATTTTSSSGGRGGGSSAADSRTIDELGTQGAMAGFFSSFEGEGGTGVFSRKSGVSGGRELRSAAEVYFKSLNGSWDLALSLAEKSPYTANRVEAGSLRRSYNTAQGASQETTPTLWGLSSATNSGNFRYNGDLNLLEVSGDIVKRTATPTYASKTAGSDGVQATGVNVGLKPKGAASQTVQVIYADDTLMVTREAPTMNSAGRGDTMKVSDPDLYLLWKRCKPVQYKKFYNKKY